MIPRPSSLPVPFTAVLVLLASLLVANCSKSGGPAGIEKPVVSPVVSTTSLAFSSVEDQREVTLTNRGAAPVGWRVEASAAWLLVAPLTGILDPGDTTVTVRVQRQGLAAGNHAGQVRFVFGAVSIPVAVTAEVAARPIPSLDRPSHDLGPDVASATAWLTNVGNTSLTWSLPGLAWVAVAPASGTLGPGASQAIVLTPDRSTLQPGTHQAGLTLESNGGMASIVLRVQVAPPPRLGLTPSSLDFGETIDALEAVLTNEGGRTLTWGASISASWARLSVTSGALAPGASRTIQVTVDRAALPAGSHRATVSVASDGGSRAIDLDVVVAPVPPPSSPPPPPPPPPISPPTVPVALAGQVIDQFTGAGLAGLTVQFDGTSAVTDGSGRFSIQGTPSSALKPLAFSGAGVHGRTTFARGTDSGWRVIPASFNMNAFDDMAREYEPRTIRWLVAPKIYIDTRAHGFSGGPQLDQWIHEVRGAAASFVSEWSNGAMTGASVTVTNAPPPDGTPGTIVIHFDEDPARYSSAQTVGLASTGWTFRREIAAATIWLRYSLIANQAWARTAVIGHELGHAVGMGHMEGSTPSIMTPRVSSPALTAFDAAAGSILYSRSPGNTSPDADNLSYYTGGLAPAGLAVGHYDWVCDAPEQRPRTITR